MDFIPIRGRKKEPTAAALAALPAAAEDNGWWEEGLQTAAAAASKTSSGYVLDRQSKRDSRHPSSSLRNALWPELDATINGAAADRDRGKKSRYDVILSKEDFLPNRGKKLLLKRIHRYLKQGLQEDAALFFPKRGKKTRQSPNSRPIDLMWLTKDDFFPHRGKRAPSDQQHHHRQQEGEAHASLDGVISGGRVSEESSMEYRPVSGLLSDLSKDDLRDKWRGRQRSGRSVEDYYDDAKIRQQQQQHEVGN